MSTDSKRGRGTKPHPRVTEPPRNQGSMRFVLNVVVLRRDVVTRRPLLATTTAVSGLTSTRILWRLSQRVIRTTVAALDPPIADGRTERRSRFTTRAQQKMDGAAERNVPLPAHKAHRRE